MTKYQQLLRSLELEPEKTDLFHANELVTSNTKPIKPIYSKKTEINSDELNKSVLTGKFQSCNEQIHV